MLYSTCSKLILTYTWRSFFKSEILHILIIYNAQYGQYFYKAIYQITYPKCQSDVLTKSTYYIIQFHML